MKRIIKKWKDQVSAQKSAHSKQIKTMNDRGKPASKTAGSPPASTTSSTTPASSGQTGSFNSNGKARTPANDGVNVNIYDDKVRNSCVGLAYNGLAVDSTAAPSEILAAAKGVEEAVFIGERGSSTTGYKNKMRSLFTNLKDPRNPSLRQRVVSGEITGKRLYTMTPQELASDDVKKEREEIHKQNLFNAQGAVEKRAITDRFTCSKCKQKKVSYFQMQTRSADEPLTTFCTCENCGKRWKFS